jgi:hypothetical protein
MKLYTSTQDVMKRRQKKLDLQAQSLASGIPIVAPAPAEKKVKKAAISAISAAASAVAGDK